MPEFGMTGLWVGGLTGMIVGMIIEVSWKQKLVVMQLGAFAGAMVGGAFEGGRFWWRMRNFRAARKSQGYRSNEII